MARAGGPGGIRPAVGLMIAWWAARSCSGRSSCPPGLLPDSFWNFTQHLPASRELRLLPPAPVPGDTWSCLAKLESDNRTQLELELVPAPPGSQDCTGLRSCPGGRPVGCCSSCGPGSGPAAALALAALRAASPGRPASFHYVGGSYALQLSSRPCPGCNMTRSWCSSAAQLGRPEQVQDCLTDQPSLLAVRPTALGSGLCGLHYTVAVPLCTRAQPYSTVSVTVLAAEGNDTCDAASSILQTSRESVTPCTASTCGNRTASPGLALLEFSFPAAPNSSYCLWLVPDSPACRAAECGFPVPGPPAACTLGPDTLARHSGLPMSEPLFIGGVCSVLAVCLLALLWVVVKCSREPPAGCSPEPDLLKPEMGSNMPRSLTIDEMEHICRLRQQEIVLVYFPDTEKFKNLNGMFKDWLQSLNILNVNHVTDIYDEKFTEGPDGVLKSPDSWVSDLLADPERRVVLVTSRLAYECLVHQRKGIAPPAFPGHEPYSALLASLLKVLDSDLFRGNYRRLICVRYEDLKICDRRYGSESFNIVPGTEYLLPQHLEDIARWIHPVEARPGLWADHRPQVRALLECIKAYRHQEDNIFTVSFYTGREDGPLLGDGCGYSGY